MTHQQKNLHGNPLQLDGTLGMPSESRKLNSIKKPRGSSEWKISQKLFYSSLISVMHETSTGSPHCSTKLRAI